ncbi:BofC C-terminal domain-containing protein [Paenibacillus sp. ACRRX]|nr:BofC C-terminal domain-containing protein [Paenibacillus sp. ACRRX]
MTGEHRSNTWFSFRMNQLKKLLKRWKRPLWSLATLLLFIGALVIGVRHMDATREKTDASETQMNAVAETFAPLHEANAIHKDALTEQVMKRLSDRNTHYIVVHRMQYICGQTDDILGSRPSSEIVRSLLDHPDWIASFDEHNRVVLEQKIDDLSETCKRNAFIGVDRDGKLTLYEGTPEKEKVIRTFFQLDVESVESALPPQVIKQLKDGIRITDIDEYNSVLSTFSDYAVEDTKKVMKPTTLP